MITYYFLLCFREDNTIQVSSTTVTSLSDFLNGQNNNKETENANNNIEDVKNITEDNLVTSLNETESNKNTTAKRYRSTTVPPTTQLSNSANTLSNFNDTKRRRPTIINLEEEDVALSNNNVRSTIATNIVVDNQDASNKESKNIVEAENVGSDAVKNSFRPNILKRPNFKINRPTTTIKQVIY